MSLLFHWVKNTMLKWIGLHNAFFLPLHKNQFITQQEQNKQVYVYPEPIVAFKMY